MPPLNKTGTEGVASSQPHVQSRKTDPVMTDPVMTDPVCGMKVNPATARHSHVHDGVTYYFCCDGCRTKFAAAPAKYLAGAAARDVVAVRPASQAEPQPHTAQAAHEGHPMHAAHAAKPRAAAAGGSYTC